jgi:hypothetical protein
MLLKPTVTKPLETIANTVCAVSISTQKNQHYGGVNVFESFPFF